MKVSRLNALQITLACVLVVLVVLRFAHEMAPLVRVKHRSLQQRAAVAPLTKHGFHLFLDKEGWVERLDIMKDTNSASDEELGCIRELVHLRGLRLEGRGFTDRALAHLVGLNKLDELDVHLALGWPGHGPLTDEGLSYLRGLESLRRLDYRGAQITNAGFRHLEGLHNLEQLTLEACWKATDDGLKSLAKLDHLESLELGNGPGMTCEGLAALPNPSRIRALHLCNVSDGGMRTITRFTNLRYLFIGSPEGVKRLGVDGLSQLLALRNLHTLFVWGVPKMDNRALEESVGGMTWLKELTIFDCPITGDARKHLPRLMELERLRVQ